MIQKINRASLVCGLLVGFLLSNNLFCHEFMLYSSEENEPCILTAYSNKLLQQHVNTKKSEPEQLLLKTLSGRQVPVRFFNRNSDTLVFCGQGFTGTAERMGVFAKIYPNYDIICIDYRWHTWKFYCTWKTLLHPINSLIVDEVEEVKTALEYFKSKKEYTDVIGHGICYSNATIIMAHVESPEVLYFTKLICDSSWLSIKDFAESITLDPWLLINPTVGGCPVLIKKVLQTHMIRAGILIVAHAITPEYSLKPYLNKIRNTPLLFIHGTEDLIVPLKTFWKVWSCVEQCPKFAFITPFAHSSAICAQALYSSMCQQFIENSPSTFWQSCCKY